LLMSYWHLKFNRNVKVFDGCRRTEIAGYWQHFNNGFMHPSLDQIQ